MQGVGVLGILAKNVLVGVFGVVQLTALVLGKSRLKRLITHGLA